MTKRKKAELSPAYLALRARFLELVEQIAALDPVALQGVIASATPKTERAIHVYSKKPRASRSPNVVAVDFYKRVRL